jgi:hypothetical protein
MSITRLQQARQMYALGQLVSKTMDGSRPGYRGDAAGRGTGDPGESDGPGAGGGNNEGPSARDQHMGTLGKTGPTDKGLKGDDAKLDYLTTRYQDINLNPTQRDDFKNFQKQVGYSISPSSKPSNRVLGGLLSMFTGIPGLGYFMGKAMDSTAMGYGLGTGTTSDDDGNREQYGAVGQYSGPPSDVVGGEGGEGITSIYDARPYQMVQNVEVEDPVQNLFASRFLQNQPDQVRESIEANMPIRFPNLFT